MSKNLLSQDVLASIADAIWARMVGSRFDPAEHHLKVQLAMEQRFGPSGAIPFGLDRLTTEDTAAYLGCGRKRCMTGSSGAASTSPNRIATGRNCFGADRSWIGGLSISRDTKSLARRDAPLPSGGGCHGSAADKTIVLNSVRQRCCRFLEKLGQDHLLCSIDPGPNDAKTPSNGVIPSWYSGGRGGEPAGRTSTTTSMWCARASPAKPPEGHNAHTRRAGRHGLGVEASQRQLPREGNGARNPAATSMRSSTPPSVSIFTGGGFQNLYLFSTVP